MTLKQFLMNIRVNNYIEVIDPWNDHHYCANCNYSFDFFNLIDEYGDYEIYHVEAGIKPVLDRDEPYLLISFVCE